MRKSSHMNSKKRHVPIEASFSSKSLSRNFYFAIKNQIKIIKPKGKPHKVKNTKKNLKIQDSASANDKRKLILAMIAAVLLMLVLGDKYLTTMQDNATMRNTAHELNVSTEELDRALSSDNNDPEAQAIRSKLTQSSQKMHESQFNSSQIAH